jgi:antitoxin (DNA-binding transcriptional repressor) of toxin-antitoxin stability system
MDAALDTDTVRKLHVENTKQFLAELLQAVDDDEEFVLFKDGEPVARVLPVSQVVERSAEYFTHYPHEAGECLYTCWRHPRIPAGGDPEGEQDEPAEADTQSVPSGSDAPLETQSQE